MRQPHGGTNKGGNFMLNQIINEVQQDLATILDDVQMAMLSQFIEMFMNTDRVRLDTMAFILMGQSPTSDSYNFDAQGLPFYQGSADFSEKYVKTRMYCSAPTRIANSGDVLMSVRAPVGTVNLTDKECCIGRGLAAIRSKNLRNTMSSFCMHLELWKIK